MKVKVNNEALATILGVKAGGTVEVKCKNGVPLEKEWRNRFKDAKVDNCISINKAPEKSNLKKEAK